jgi:hypothetical protein
MSRRPSEFRRHKLSRVAGRSCSPGEDPILRHLINTACALGMATLLGCTDSPVAPSSLPPPPTSPFAKLVGDYALTIELDETCAVFPSALRVRTYDAKIVDPWSSHHYAILFVVGGGFSDPFDIGEFFPLYPPSDSQFRFEWNNFDVGGFDYAEPLPDSSELYVSLGGLVTLTESTISGTLQGGAFVLKDRSRSANCGGSHRVTFVRRAG